MCTLLIILDGLCEYPLPELGGRTPLEAAYTPAMDEIARHSRCVRVRTCPPGLSPATDCCVLTLLGYDIDGATMPGRGYIEACGAGLQPRDGETVYRCNIAPISRCAHQPIITASSTTSVSSEALSRLIAAASAEEILLHPTTPGHLLAILPPAANWNEGYNHHSTLLPNQLIGHTAPAYADSRLNRLAQASREILGDATLLFWGGGKASSLPRLWPGGTMITAVEVMKGIASIAGMNVVTHHTFTGNYDTNYSLKASTAIEAIERTGASEEGDSLIVLHIEAPDTVSHLTGTALQKIRVIEDIDRLVIGPVLKYINAARTCNDAHIGKEIRLILTTDHFTDCTRGIHHPDPVPMAIYNRADYQIGMSAFNEAAFANAEMIR